MLELQCEEMIVLQKTIYNVSKKKKSPEILNLHTLLSKGFKGSIFSINVSYCIVLNIYIRMSFKFSIAASSKAFF